MADTDDQRRLTCNLCNETFNRQSSLVRHRQVKHSDALEVFKCPKCPKILSRRDLLLRHERLHQGEGLRACYNCSRAVRSDYLPKHIKTCLRKTGDRSKESPIGDRSPLTASGIGDDRQYVGNLTWKDIRYDTSANRSSTRSPSQMLNSTDRRAQQPARFVTMQSSLRPHPPSSLVTSGVLDFGSSSSAESRSTSPEPPQKSFAMAELFHAIMQDDRRFLACKVRNMKEAGFTWKEIERICVAETEGGLPMLMLAAWEGSYWCLSYLIHEGIDVNARGQNGWTALHCACFNGQAACASLLLDHGADLKVELQAQVDDSERSVTPLWLAVERGYGMLAESLILWGADVNGGTEPKGPSPLQCACRNNDVQIALLLLENRADWSGKPGSPSPLDEAMSHNSRELIKMLGGNIQRTRDDGEQRGRVLEHAANSYLQEAQRYFPAAFAEKSPLGSP